LPPYDGYSYHTYHFSHHMQVALIRLRFSATIWRLLLSDLPLQPPDEGYSYHTYLFSQHMRVALIRVTFSVVIYFGLLLSDSPFQLVLYHLSHHNPYILSFKVTVPYHVIHQISYIPSCKLLVPYHLSYYIFYIPPLRLLYLCSNLIPSIPFCLLLQPPYPLHFFFQITLPLLQINALYGSL
jgi:hypothetical protein